MKAILKLLGSKYLLRIEPNPEYKAFAVNIETLAKPRIGVGESISYEEVLYSNVSVDQMVVTSIKKSISKLDEITTSERVLKSLKGEKYNG
jgi:hypothetical protein